MTEPMKPINGLTTEASEEFRRVYHKLDTINEIVVAIRNDRKWVFTLLGVVGIGVSLAAAQMGEWSGRLGTVESKVDSHSSQSIEVHNGLRRDVSRNAIDIEKLNEKTWRPRDASKKERE